MKEIRFSYNWNNKLNCHSYTTIRIHNPSKYEINIRYNKLKILPTTFPSPILTINQSL